MYLHFGTPCSNWSSLSHLNGSSRTTLVPAGIRPLCYREHRSLQQVDRMCVLCFLLHIRNGYFTIENPRESLMFRSSPFVLLTELVTLSCALVDQCQYDLRPPGPAAHEFIRKSTKIYGNFRRIESISRTCPGKSSQHEHVHALGSRKVADETGHVKSVSVAIWASRYPAELCDAIARCVAEEWTARHRKPAKVTTVGSHKAASPPTWGVPPAWAR